MILLILLSVLIPCQSENPYAFKPACDLHDSKHGRETPNTMIFNPEPTDSSWFFATKEEILKYYKKGKAECEAFMADKESIKTYLHDNHAPFYTAAGQLPYSGQSLCRGRASLYDLTGMTVWPFGPYKECKSYSKCWFGLLSCGKFKSNEVYQQTIKEISSELIYLLKTYKDPSFPAPSNPAELKWTIRSLVFHIRLLGSELVSPDLRLLSLYDDASTISDDVMIGQYHLTIPDESYQLDVRLAELYPSIFYPWDPQPFEKYGLKELATIFLGGSESRCRTWTKCPVNPFITKCDENSFIVKSPFPVKVIDGSNDCPNLKSLSSLPICSAANSPLKNPIPSMAPTNSFLNSPGRWIHSASRQLASNCVENKEEFPSYNIISMKPGSDSDSSTTASAAKSQSSTTNTPNRRPLSFYASGNPCIHNELLEELQSGHWFYSPYHCRYHFYTRNEIMSCLHSQEITHIHFQGDSISRELFTALSHYLGIISATEKEMKILTNKMKQNNIRFYANDSTTSYSVLLSEGYSWDWNLDIMKLIEEPPLPNVLVMNYGLAHRATFPYHFEKELNNTELQYWKHLRNKSLPYPKYMIFQNAKELNGKREIQFRSNRFREDSTLLKRMYLQELGCMELDEFLLSLGKFDNYSVFSGIFSFFFFTVIVLKRFFLSGYLMFTSFTLLPFFFRWVAYNGNISSNGNSDFNEYDM
jgi:hypothetical protein